MSSHAPDQRVLCPTGEPDTAFEHYTTAEDLAKNRGVCSKCFERIHQHHAKIQRGLPETPATFDSLKNHTTFEQDHIGFDDTGERETVTDFDYDAADPFLRELFQEADRDARHTAGTLLGLLLGWCWSQGFAGAFRKFAVITAGLRPDLLNDATFKEIGKELGVTRAAVSKCAVNFQRAFRIKFARSRGEEARQRMAQARLRNPVARNGKPKSHCHCQPPSPP